MRTTDFDFYLPEALIAQFPTTERSASRLLYVDGKNKKLQDSQFKHLCDFFKPNDVMVFNDTRVIKARLFGNKLSGGKLELMVERVLSENRFLTLIKSSKSPKANTDILIADVIPAKVLGREGDLFLVEVEHAITVLDLLEEYGYLPLPPYIEHQADETDESRYQTVYAKVPGAVAAPTAGLHFDDAMFEALKQHGVHIAHITLHVGAGTFQPVRVEEIAEHKMHSEVYSIPQATVDAILQCKALGGRVTAVGTTSLRALESAARSGELMAGQGETDIFITPGYTFKVVERLITNFHLPKSTLLMLVSAFAGYDQIMQAYAHAIEERYRFFSYGDAMLLEKA